MRTPKPSETSLIILAGGQGQRLLGRDKARIQWRGQSLLQQLVDEFSPDFRELVIVRSRARSQLFRHPKVVWAHDDQAHQGPVAGLIAGLKRASSPWCLCLPVDCVAPPQQLLASLSKTGPAFAEHQGQRYYLHSLIPRHYRRPLLVFHHDGGRAMKNACQVLGLKAQNCHPSHSTIWSLNTPEELRQARRRRLH